MPPDTWPVVAAAALLGAAAALQATALRFKSPSTTLRRAAVALRGAAAAALLWAAVWAAQWQGGWSPAELRQLAIGLALAALLVDLALVVALRLPAAGLAADVVVLALIAWSAFGVLATPGGAPLPALLRVQWLSWQVGAGAAVVSGSAGLALAAATVLARRGHISAGQARPELHAGLYYATALAFAAFGIGLAAGVMWAWQNLGSLGSGDARQAWIAAGTLTSAAGLSAERLGRHSGRWAAALAVTTAGLAVFGLLAVPDLHRLLGL